MDDYTVANAKAMLTIKYGKTAIKIDTKRLLTSGEVALAQLIFKNSIDYTKVYIRRGGLGGIPDASKNAMTPFGSIHLPNEDYDKIKDFSIDRKATNKIWFIHEMTHVWQYQLGLNVAARGIEIGIRGGYSDAKAYDYDLICDDQCKKFNQFNFEQQAEIICHYYDAYHLPVEGHNYPILHNKNIMQKFALKNILKDFLADPSNSELLSKNYGGIYYHQEPKRY
ncbi:zinc protease [Acinetobacter bereziniae]|uniref:zinc protease n=2 Tax=Acinetobacter bereziniae TaxID=106648 RepID=UPI001115B09E|nr:zinc protease [Acinetobacter bereziniae]TNL58986.1 zinc protease [Acinetobacter bereziniae]